MTVSRRTFVSATAAATMLAMGAPALAQDDFYAGKTVTIVVGAPPTGSYASYSLLLANHLGKHIPGNPSVVTDFQGGADGGLSTANYMERAAPKDGTFIGITQQTIPVNQFLQPDTSHYDVSSWEWIGGIAPDPATCCRCGIPRPRRPSKRPRRPRCASAPPAPRRPCISCRT